MPLLFDFPNEILDKILDRVRPSDFENFTLSCKFIHELAGKRLEEHRLLKKNLSSVRTGYRALRGYRVPELLDRFLFEPRTADYISELLIHGCHHCWEQPRDGGDDIHRQYLDGRMKAFEKAVKDTDYIPSADKEGWISRIHAGAEEPLITLLFTQLHCVTKVTLGIDNERSALFEALKSIVTDPRSVSLSQLRNVEIYPSLDGLNQHMGLAVCFAALPSVISLTARHLHEGASRSKAISFDLPPQSSNVRELNLDHCKSSIATTSMLIAGIKSLRSFQCSGYIMAFDRLFPNMLTTLQQHASSSLEELSIFCSEDVIFHSKESILGEYTHLRLLTIRYATTIERRSLTTDVMTKFLPASVEVLNFVQHQVKSFAWLQAMVESIVSMKRRTVRALRQLNINETFLSSCPPSQTREMYEEAAEAGIKITSVSYEDLVASLRGQ